MKKTVLPFLLFASFFLTNCPGKDDNGDDSITKVLLLNMAQNPVVGEWVQPVSGSATKGACQWLNMYQSNMSDCYSNYTEGACYNLPATSGHEGSSVLWSTSDGATSTDENDNLCRQNGYGNCTEYLGNYLRCPR